jgi:transposase
METIYFLGIDLAKETFQATLTLDGVNISETKVENNSKSIRSYFQDLRKKFSPSQLMVCIEHTGIYSNPLLDYLTEKGIKVCVESALQIKKSQGIKRGKSDKVDARRIAQYLHKNHQQVKFWHPSRTVIQKIKALLVVRERLVKTRVQLATPIKESENYIEESLRKNIIKCCQNTLHSLTKDILKVEREIDILIKQDNKLEQEVQLATSIPGVGNITALNIIVASNEFESISEVKKFACYAGVAPFEYTSGTTIRGKTRVSKLANMTVKKLLNLSAMSAVQHCYDLKIYYTRKVAQGKNKMSVLNAVRNKLISRIYACVKNKRMYQKEYQHELA